MEGFKNLLRREFAPVGVLSAKQLQLLEEHFNLLLRWNEKLNLTRITGLSEAVRLHYCESLLLADFLPKRTLKIVDVGSGAGFPGLPIGVYRDDCKVDLIETHQRKAVFLSDAVRQLRLNNVKILSKRAIEVEGGYDWLVSRAVNPDEISRLHLAPNIAFLGSDFPAAGSVALKIPWGESRYLFHVERSAGST